MTEFEKQNASFIFWEGITGIKPKQAIAASHKRIVEFSKNNKIPITMICEDDVRFVAPGAYQYFISNIPSEFDLYLGGISSGEIKDGMVKRFTGLFCYAIHERFYDKFLSTPIKMPLDVMLGFAGGLYKICYPFAATCYNGYSDARGRFVNDDKHFRERKLFTNSQSGDNSQYQK